MKAPITLIALAFTLGLTYPLQCMETPLLSDKLGTLRTNLDTLKKSLSKLKQRLEALKKALRKPSGGGNGGGGPGGGGPGGGGGTPGSKFITPFQSLPKELHKEIESFVLESDIKFNFTDSKSLYNSIKAAGRKISTIRLLSKYYAEQYKMSVVIGIISRLLNKQLEQEGKTLDVTRSKHKSFPYTVLDFALDDDNVVICKILLSMDAKKHGKIITHYGLNQVLRQPKISKDFQLITLFLKYTDYDDCKYLLGWLLYHNIFVPEIMQLALDAQDPDYIRLLFFIAPSHEFVKKIIEKLSTPKNAQDLEYLIKLFCSEVHFAFYTTLDSDDWVNLLKALGSQPIGIAALTHLVGIAFGNNDLYHLKEILSAAGNKKSEVVINFLKTKLAYLEIDPDVLGELLNAGGYQVKDELLSDVGDMSDGLNYIIQHDILGKNFEVVQEILKALGNRAVEVVVFQDNSGKTPLHYAVQAGRLDIVQVLLNVVGNKVKALGMLQDGDNKTVLHCAVEQGKLEIVQAILDALGENVVELVLVQDKDNKTVLHYAVAQGKLEIVQAILKAAGKRAVEVVLVQDKDNKTALHYAVEKGEPEILQALLDAVAGQAKDVIELQDVDGKTVLHYAVEKDDPEILQTILEAAGNSVAVVVAVIDNNEKTVLHYAVEKGNPKIVQAILKAVGDSAAKRLVIMQDQEGQTALHIATICNNYNPEVVQAIMSVADVRDLKDKYGMSVLAHAIIAKNLEMVEKLIPDLSKVPFNLKQFQQQEMLVMMVDEQKKTVLHYDISLNNLEIVKLVLAAAGKKAKELVLAQDDQGNTILHTLSEEASPEAVQAVLIAAGEKEAQELVMKNNTQLESTLYYAIKSKNPEIVKIILKAAGNMAKVLVFMKNPDGGTALHWAVWKNNAEMVEAILQAAGDKAKALVEAKNKQGEIALKLASKSATKIKELLEQYAK